MYIPPHYRAADSASLLAFMRRYSFATLVTQVEGRPFATHLPVVLREDGATLHLSAHLARANPQCKTLTDQTALVIFAEPHAYVSPSHYDRPLNVPTWNYIAVHAYGRATLLPDLAASLAALEAMIDHFEPGYRSQWEGLPDDYKHKMAAGIVAFEIAVEELQGKEKLSQNKTEAERARITQAFAEGDDAQARALAAYMAAEAPGHG
jgi:transcriptional regulator